MDSSARGTRAFTRAVAILVLIGGFAATQQIEVKQIDALVVVGVAVAMFVALLAGVVAIRSASEERALALSLTEAGVFAAGALTIFGIFRTVLPQSTSFQSGPVLGLGLVVLLLLIWLATEGGGIFRNAGPRAAERAAVGDATSQPGTPPGEGSTLVGGGTQGRPLNLVQVLVAFAVVVTYGAMLYGLWQSTAVDDKAWSRLIELKSGIEQVAFAALGALLGFVVQGRATDTAKDEAQTARKEADQSVAQKEAALSLAKDAVSVASGGAASGEVESFGAAPEAGRAADPAVRIAVLRERLRSLEAR